MFVFCKEPSSTNSSFVSIACKGVLIYRGVGKYAYNNWSPYIPSSSRFKASLLTASAVS